MAQTIASRGVAGSAAPSGNRGTDGTVNSGFSGKDVSNREDLSNFISMITRDETPFMSSIGKTKATAIYHEWQTDELQEPGNSRIVEGQDYADPRATYAALDPEVGRDFNITGPDRTRLGNYCQINGKTIAVSGTRRAVDQAGVADEYAYQLKKRGTEMRRDIEHDLVQTANVASGSGNRQMGTYRAWINDSDIVVLNGSTEATTEGAGSAAPGLLATSSRVALSLADVDQVMQNIYEAGGKADRIMVSPKLRRDFSDLMVTDSGVRRNLDEKGKLRQSVDVYMSDFGDLMVVPNYIMGLGGDTDTSFANEAAFIYDSQWFSIATLRPLQEVDVGQKGDSTVGMMVEEFTLEVKNPKGCGAIYGLK